MSFRDHIAPKRESPGSDRITSENAVSAKASDQELLQPQSSKFRTVSTEPKPEQHVGNLVRVQPNNKGTGVFGRPSSFGESIRDKSDPAVVNPSGARNDTTVKYRG